MNQSLLIRPANDDKTATGQCWDRGIPKKFNSTKYVEEEAPREEIAWKNDGRPRKNEKRYGFALFVGKSAIRVKYN